MYKERSISPHESTFNGYLPEGLVTMMELGTAISSYDRPQDEDNFDEGKSIRLARKVHDNAELLHSIFTDPAFHPAAAYPNLAPIASLCLLAAPHVVMQNIKQHTDRSLFKEELSAFNTALRGVIRANPNLSKDGLLAVLDSAIHWASLPACYNDLANAEFRIAMGGASGEVIAEQLLNSEPVKAAGILYNESTMEDDIQGSDFTITLPGVGVIKVDIKNNPEQIDAPIPITYGIPRYKIEDIDHVRLHHGDDPSLRGGRLQLSEEQITQKSEPFLATLLEIGKKINELKYRRAKKRNRQFGRTATRLAGD